MQQESFLPNSYKKGDVVRVGDRAGRIVQINSDETRVQIEFPLADGNQTLWHDVSELPALTTLEKSRLQDDIQDEATLAKLDEAEAEQGAERPYKLTFDAEKALADILGEDDDEDDDEDDPQESEIARLTAELEKMEKRVELLVEEIAVLRGRELDRHLENSQVQFKTIRREYDEGGKGNGVNEFDREVQKHLREGWEIIGVHPVHENYGDFLYAFMGKKAQGNAVVPVPAMGASTGIVANMMDQREAFLEMVKRGASANELMDAGDAMAYIAGKKVAS